VLRDGRLQSAEAEIGSAVAHARDAEANGARVAVARELFDYRPARIAEPEHLRDLVVSLARRVVARAREHFVLARLRHEEEVRVPARDDEREGRVHNRRVIEDDGVDVAFDVVDAD
jgi:hypothetical protein